MSVGRQGSAGEHGKRASEAIDGNGQTGDPFTSDSVAGIPGAVGSSRALREAASWLSGTRLGLAVMALIVGAFAGLAAALFRWLIYAFTWLATGHRQFGQQGHAASLHMPWLGLWFVFVIPVVGGLLYGPLIARFASEARGHGVPEVMLAVAENGGRIRPPVTIVKALASAICIGTGGSVGREGPIVQVGSAMGSTVGQLVRMSENRLRIIVACGAAGGIAATFNAPITGLFFGFEIILREFSLDALFATSLAAVTGAVVSRAFFGSAPFFTAIPHGLTVGGDYTYLLIVVLGIAAGLIGVAFKTFLYRLEDVADELWKGRPEWARPAVGGLLLGGLLLALPQMYGVGYPVMDRSGGRPLPAVVHRRADGRKGARHQPHPLDRRLRRRVRALAVHRRDGGNGVRDRRPTICSGAAIGPPAMYAVVAMGGVFGAAAQAPLTAIASVVEMTGNFTLTVPVMLAVGIASALSKHLSYGSIYTTKLLRRGIDIERPKTSGVLQRVTVAEVMQRFSPVSEQGAQLQTGESGPADSPARRRATVGGSDRRGRRHPAAAGAVCRRDAGSGATPARPLRPRGAAGAIPRRRAPAGVDHAAERSWCNRSASRRVGSRDRAGRARRRVRAPRRRGSRPYAQHTA